MDKSNVAIATPCGERWETMTPEGGGRLCVTCDKVVHDLSSMSEARAQRLLASKKNLCVRYLFDEHGNIWFEGDRPPLAARLLNRAKRGAVAAVAIAAPLMLQACLGTMPDEYPATEADAGNDDPGRDVANPVLGRDAGTTADDDASADDGDQADSGDDASEDAGDGGS